MAADTKINESLTCIGIAFVGLYPKATYSEFIDMFFDPKNRKFGGVVKNCEIQLKDKTDYTKTYKKPPSISIKNETVNNWYAIAYFTGKALHKNIGVQLHRYDVLRLAKSDSEKGYFLKGYTISKIRDQYKKMGGEGYTRIVNAEKVLIADIILYSRRSFLKEKLEKEIDAETLTLTSYKNLLNTEFDKKRVIPVSLKSINTKNPTVKFINKPSSVTLKKDVEDEFYEEIMILSRLAMNKNKQLFLDRLDKFIEIDYPVNFNDRNYVRVNFNFKYRTGIIKKYNLWTNFSGGQSAIHISEAASQSQSGEGGLTVKYFEELSKHHTKIRNFFKQLSSKRIEVFKKIIEPENADKLMYELKKNNPKITSFFDSSLKSEFYPMGVSSYNTLFKELDKMGKNDISERFFEEYSYELIKKRYNKYNPNNPHEGHQLTGYEVGYFFDNQNSLIKEIIKKQVLMSWYSASSGRGFIIINRKKFEMQQFYIDEMDQPPAYIKVGS